MLEFNLQFNDRNYIMIYTDGMPDAAMIITRRMELKTH
jgi:hypothetical protein